MLYGYDSFRDASVRILESRVNVIIFRNLLSRCLHCAQLYRGRSLFSPPFLASSPSFFFSDLLSLIEPSSRRVDQRQDFFFSFHLCTRRRVRVRVYSRIHTSLATPLSVSSHPAHPLLDVLGRSLIHVDTQNARIHARRGLHILTNLPTCIVFSEFPTRYAIHREIMIVPNSILLLHLYSL